MIHNDPCFESRISHWIMDHCGSLFLIHKDHNVFFRAFEKETTSPQLHPSWVPAPGFQRIAVSSIPQDLAQRLSGSAEGFTCFADLSMGSMKNAWDILRSSGIFDIDRY